ncbi:hypothetical protein NX059_007680 [Neofusicoccum parvum]|nr:hypothetical protein NX059_007680 [Neofusicoccum parvum]
MEGDKVEPIAIIGLSLKFPDDATSAESFWKMLAAGRSASKEIPPERFNVDAFYHPDPERLDSFHVRRAHFIEEDLAAFDAPFFNMSPAEAQGLDPQQRGLLEGTYHALENAGIPIRAIAGSNTSVHVASFGRDWDAMISQDTEFQSKYTATGTGSSMLSNRISHFYDLRGPSLTVDTACSSGLYAFHLACQSLRLGESEIGIVSGSNTYLSPHAMSVPLSNAGFLSPDGRCYSFDHKANGYARGEGFGTVIIKPLRNAIRDGDTIRAVVRASGVNQDGRTPSITQPSAVAQAAMIRATYAAGGLDFGTTQYIEAHGTGTSVGDPLEAQAIGEVFRDSRDAVPLHVGSVKTNIGHLEGASGLAGLLKTVLVLEKGLIPPNVGFEKPNPSIDTEFPTQLTPWPTAGLRRASVSSFGYGGSNAHVVMEDACNYLRIRNLKGHHSSVDFADYPDSGSNGVKNGQSNGITAGNLNGNTGIGFKGLLVLSAADEQGPQRQADALQKHFATTSFEDHSTDNFMNTLQTLYQRRSSLDWRSFAIAGSTDELALELAEKVVPGLCKMSFIVPQNQPTYTLLGCRSRSAHAFKSHLLNF